MFTGRGGASINQDQPGSIPPSRPARLSTLRIAHKDLSDVGPCLVRNFSTNSSGACRRAAKRAVLAAEYRGGRVAHNHRSPQHGPAVPTGRLPSQHGHGEEEKVGVVDRPRAARTAPGNPAPKRGPADLRCPVEELAPGPSTVEGRKKARPAMGHSPPILISLFPRRPLTAAVPRAPASSVRRRCGDAPRARPSSGAAHDRVRVEVRLAPLCPRTSAMLPLSREQAQV
jgi:hypothetical protein